MDPINTRQDNRTYLRTIGDRGEDCVVQYLTDCGYRVIARNYNVPGVGELDIVLEKEGVLYITEVKSRKNIGPYPHSAESVGFAKRKRIYNATRRFMSARGYFDRDIVFLLGCVTHDDAGNILKVEVIPF